LTAVGQLISAVAFGKMRTEEVRQQETNSNKKQLEPRRGKTNAVILGLIFAIMGSIIAGAYAKNTITNYSGFSMLLVGVALFVLGICSIVNASLVNRLSKEAPYCIKCDKHRMLCLSIRTTGVGVILGIMGSVVGGAYAKTSIMNSAGFIMLLTGIGVFVLGLSGAAVGAIRIELQIGKKSGSNVNLPKILFFDIGSIGVGVMLIILGLILTHNYVKQNSLNFAGFGMEITGIAVLSMGASGTGVAFLRSRIESGGLKLREINPRAVMGSVWAIGLGVMLLLIGSTLSNSYAKSTLMNFTGFAMLLIGTAAFLLGGFETARFAATNYLNNRQFGYRDSKTPKKPSTIGSGFRAHWQNLVKTSAILNLAGVITAVCVLFFSLWQLDLIVSGPVWWSSLPKGGGYGWSHPNGAYANEYFQCFIWKTTIGQAYDTLFMLVFVSFIVMFVSAYFWPRMQVIGGNKGAFKMSGRENYSKRRRAKRRKRKTQVEPESPKTTEPVSDRVPIEQKVQT
jgi:hypothetical protein